MVTWDSGTTSSASYTWTQWVTTSSATTSSSNDGIWSYWTTTGTDYAGTSTTSSTWTTWVSNARPEPIVYSQPYRPRELTPEQKEAQRQAAEQARLESERRQREQEEAKKRAEDLLVGCLTLAQRRQLKKRGSFVVKAQSGQHYRVRRGHTVEELDKAGKPAATHCIHTRDYVPDFDTMLVQKLMLEANEDEFLRVANRTPVRA